MEAKTRILIRFEGRLGDFLAPKRRGRALAYEIEGRPGLLDAVQALGVPHAETGEVEVNGRPSDLSYRIADGDEIIVRPRADASPSKPAFILDVHLGRLARYLRLAGFDCLYENDYADLQITEIASKTGRIVLTRDVGLLKRRRIGRGYWLRSSSAREQAREVLARYGAERFAEPFTRCLSCNGLLEDARKEDVIDLLPSSARRNHDAFRCCAACGKVYWKGGHFRELGETAAFLCGKTSPGADETLEKAS